MKKVSLLTAVSLIAAQGVFAAAPEATAPAAMCPNCFKGFFLGGNIGYDMSFGKQRVTETIGGVPGGDVYTLSSKSVGARGVDGGINVGYNYVFGNKFGLGLEFVANWANTTGKVTVTNPDAFAVGTTNTLLAKAKMDNSLQLRANFSYVIANLVAPKIILGWDNSRWKQNFSSNEEAGAGGATFKFKNSHRYNAFLYGFGVDFCAMKHVILGVEYTGTVANSKKFSKTDTATDNAYTAHFKPQRNTIALVAKVIY